MKTMRRRGRSRGSGRDGQWGGVPTAALITDMDEPLCDAVGNAVEVAVCLRVLEGDRMARRGCTT
jgi:thymidine phosphorylase